MFSTIFLHLVAIYIMSYFLALYKRSEEKLESQEARFSRLRLHQGALEEELRSLEMAVLQREKTFNCHVETMKQEADAQQKESVLRAKNEADERFNEAQDSANQRIADLEEAIQALRTQVKAKDDANGRCTVMTEVLGDRMMRVSEGRIDSLARHEVLIAENEAHIRATRIEAEECFNKVQDSANHRNGELEETIQDLRTRVKAKDNAIDQCIIMAKVLGDRIMHVEGQNAQKEDSLARYEVQLAEYEATLEASISEAGERLYTASERIHELQESLEAHQKMAEWESPFDD